MQVISKTKPWPAPGLRSIFLAVLLRLPRWGPGAIATGILARCQEYTKRMPSGCQGNAKGMPSACHEECQEDAMWGNFRTYINAGGNTRVFPPLCDCCIHPAIIVPFPVSLPGSILCMLDQIYRRLHHSVSACRMSALVQCIRKLSYHRLLKMM